MVLQPLDLDTCPALSSSSIDFVGQPTNRSPLGFKVQTKKTIAVILRHKSSNRSCRFWGPNQETRSHRFWGKIGRNHQPWFCGQTKKLMLLVHGVDRTQRHSISRSSGHWVPDLCLTIPDSLHQVSYSCHDPHHCPPCHIYHMYTTRQANTILHTR
jgi:hypothetical protein